MGVAVIGGDDRLGVERPVPVDMVDGFVETVDHPASQDQFQVFRVPVLLAGDAGRGSKLAEAFVTAQLHPESAEDLIQEWYECFGDILVDQECFQGIAHAGRWVLALAMIRCALSKSAVLSTKI